MTSPYEGENPVGINSFDASDLGLNGNKQDDKGEGKRSVASVMVDIATQKYDLGISSKDVPFAVPKDGAKVIKMLRGGKGSLRAELAKDYWNETGKVASQQALADALLVLEGQAQELDPEVLHMRVAESDGVHYYDLGRTDGKSVRITGEGWEVVDDAPVRFERSALTSPAAEPDRTGTFADLLNLTNASREDKPLLVSAMVATFFETIAHPVVVFTGEQGTGKSTNATKVTGIIDPSPVPLRSSPKDEQGWITAAQGSWVVSVDNLSVIPQWLSDSFCKASTGDGSIKRQLYTDSSLAVISFRRCVFLTGIDLGGLPGDLTERLLRIELKRIDTKSRLSEKAMMTSYEESRGRILGALLTLVSKVIEILPNIVLKEALRLADFHHIVKAVDVILGTRGEEQYLNQNRSMASDSLAGDPFIAKLQETIGDEFTGTSEELLHRVPADSPLNPPKGWPKSSRAVTTVMRRNAPQLRKTGWTVDDTPNRKGVTEWTIIPPSAGYSAGYSDEEDRDNRQLTGITGTTTPETWGKTPLAGLAGQESGTSLMSSAGLAGQNTRNSPYLTLQEDIEKGTQQEMVGNPNRHNRQTGKCSIHRTPLQPTGRCFRCEAEAS